MQEIAGILIGSNQAQPLSGVSAAGSRGSLRSFNHEVCRLAQIENAQISAALAAPPLASAIPITSLETLIFLGLCEGMERDPEAFADFIWKSYDERGERMVKDGQPIDGAENNRRHVSEKLQEILDKKKPLWELLGMF